MEVVLLLQIIRDQIRFPWKTCRSPSPHGRQWGLAAAALHRLGQLSLSPFQLQQRNQGSPDDRHISAGQQQSVISTNDVGWCSEGDCCTTIGYCALSECTPACLCLCHPPQAFCILLKVPASETQDSILFLINNISSANFETKAKELTEILEPCQSSLAYQPPNPWTMGMGILGLLLEIYALPNLKMNFKFDIERTSLLKDRDRELDGYPDFSSKDVTATKPQIVPEVNPPINVEPQPDVMIPSHPGGLLTKGEKMPALSLPERLPTSIANIETEVIANPKISALGLRLQFQRIVPAERAVKEIMSPVVQRSVLKAIQTTKELALKVFVMQSDETHIYNAAHLMVVNLYGASPCFYF
ncbi:hypothetical protein C5167_025396 [Papaver somniferum]|uniref:Uncharacterized protein n=1 Tax=Papaver somniferum TaxID=3469 RepID=A0A4Y7JSE5_PAPSO|nr:hypothetical protein C5167_025396 [Papaver somniferum]